MSPSNMDSHAGPVSFPLVWLWPTVFGDLAAFQHIFEFKRQRIILKIPLHHLPTFLLHLLLIYDQGSGSFEVRARTFYQKLPSRFVAVGDFRSSHYTSNFFNFSRKLSKWSTTLALKKTTCPCRTF